MTLTELFIRRPVMTVLLNIALIAVGAAALGKIPVAALPRYDTPTINVSARLNGASPETMARSVALPLEKQFSTIAGVNAITSTSSLGRTSITLEFNPDRDIDAAAGDVQAALLRTQRALPSEMDDLPSYRKVNPADAPVLILALSSPTMSLTQVTDFAENLVSPSLSTIDGVAQVTVWGAKRYAVRVQAKPEELALRGLTLDDVANAIRATNANSPMGQITGPAQTLIIESNTQLKSAAQFRELIVAVKGGTPVYLRDVALIRDGSENESSLSRYNGTPSVILAVQRQPDANTVAVIDAIYSAIPKLQGQLPSAVTLHTLNDRGVSIRDALNDIYFTLALTIALVVLVIFLFLRRVWATVIPTLSIPVSLISAMSLLYYFDYSLDNISMLGITLAVGLVVDDAIVMLENIVRHIENGMEPFAAAIRGAREVAFTIVSISISLVAVLIPIFFMPGTLGLLFHEFAVIVGLAIMVSAVVSLTLVPMLCSRFLTANDVAHASDNAHNSANDSWAHRSTQWFEDLFQATLRGYARALDWALVHKRTMLGVTLGSVALTVGLFISMPKGFFPQEDIGQVMASVVGAEDVGPETMQRLLDDVAARTQKHPAVASMAAAVFGGNSGRMFITLKPKDERGDLKTVLGELRRATSGVAGVKVFFIPMQNLRVGGRASRSQYQYTLQSVSGSALSDWANKVMDKLKDDDRFADVTSDSERGALQAELVVDRERAQLLGITSQSLRNMMYSAFGERQVASIYTDAGTWSVILTIDNPNNQSELDLMQLHLRTASGELVPLSAFASVKRSLGPTSINHQGQLQAVTISFNLATGTPLGQATQALDGYVKELGLPTNIITSYGGEAAVFKESQTSQVVLLLAAVVVIYILLGMLYESFIHPITILAGLPSAVVGGLLTLQLFGQDITIIATIGLLMLIGIVKKNAIMMIDFALDAQRSQGIPAAQAIRQACLLRFRPIMMTTLTAAIGALPIALGHGASAELRQPLGLAVVGGLILSQVVTLFITPVIYLLLDRFSGNGPITTVVTETAA
ncbi:MAG: efflux RND transporter permease subunit [Burkholderiaceae bacterium]|nr:efflux RND transporter permease subunit [Burkholderiaceae bacterium]